MFQRQRCYLCDLPRMPWALLKDFSELVCRGCVNYEGIDRIEFTLEATRKLKKSHLPVHQLNNNTRHAMVNFIPATPVNNLQLPTISTRKDTMAFHHLKTPCNPLHMHSMQYHRFNLPLDTVPTRHQRLNSCEGETEVANYTPVNSTSIVFTGEKNSAETESMPLNLEHHYLVTRKKSRPSVKIEKDSLCELPRHVQKSLKSLQSSTPFKVRRKFDHLIQGNVLKFDAVMKATGDSSKEVESELNIIVDCDSFQRRLSTSKEETTSANCFCINCDLNEVEYELTQGSGNWHLLGDLLTDQVRRFKDSPNISLLPRPKNIAAVKSPNHSHTSSFYSDEAVHVSSDGVWNFSTKRHLDETERQFTGKRMKVETMNQKSFNARFNSETLHRNPILAPSPGQSRSPERSALAQAEQSKSDPEDGYQSGRCSSESSLSGVQAENLGTSQCCEQTDLRKSLSYDSPGKAYSQEGRSPSSNDNSSQKPSAVSQEALKCLTCRLLLDDSHFVQCPTVAGHRFCFACAKENIRKQGEDGDVFCPSGSRCLLVGSSVPWAFMRGELATIMGGI